MPDVYVILEVNLDAEDPAHEVFRGDEITARSEMRKLRRRRANNFEIVRGNSKVYDPIVHALYVVDA